MKVTRQLPNQASAVPAVRHLIDDLLGRWPPDARQTVELLASELATNCVRHTSGGFQISIDLAEERVRVEVTDLGTGMPVAQTPPPTQPNGRGLQIVDALAHAWGVRTPGGAPGRAQAGKTVWFTYQVGAAPRTAEGQASPAR